MNILPTKSWHVRNKKNIERVRRDEAKAAEEEKEKQRKIAIAESEARSEILREAAKRKREDESGVDKLKNKLDVDIVPQKHINFFEDLEAGNRQGKKNKERELEIKLEKEKKEKEIGYLTYLGQNSNELNDTKSWYNEVRTKEETKSEAEVKRKRLLDPLSSMSKYLDKTSKYNNSKHPESSCNNNGPIVKHQPQSFRPHLPKTIDQLRAERLLREKAERLRQKQLLEKLDPKNNLPIPQPDERSRSYNSRYNPQLSTR